MFGFGKKKKSYFSCKVMMSRTGLNALLSAGVNSKDFLLITFFASTRNELLQLCPGAEEQIISAEQILNGAAVSFISSFLRLPRKQIVLAERYPLSTRETQVAEKLSAAGIAFPVPAFAALDDTLLLKAGGEKIISLMQKMGMGEAEIIEHSMIESSIEKLQGKIEAAVPAESKTRSPQEWFQLNVPG